MTYVSLSKAAIAMTVAISMVPTTGQARSLSLGQAVEKCTQRAVEYGRKPFGRFAEAPPESKVQDQYRACVFANSGQYPTAKVDYRESVVTLLNDVLK